MSDKQINYLLYTILLLILFIGFYIRLEYYDFLFINEWAARDFDRAFNLFEGNYIPLAGPELNNGGRLPGPFLYFLLSFPLLFQKSYESIFIFNFVLNFSAVFLLFWVLKKQFNIYVATLFSIFILIFIPHSQIFGYPINPSFIFPFVALLIWFSLEIFDNEQFYFLPLFYLVTTLAIQIHFSMATFYVVPIALCIILKIKPPKKHIYLSLFAILLAIAPYLVYKYQTYVPFFMEFKTREHTIHLIDFLSIKELLKSIFLYKTLMRLTYFSGAAYWVPFSDAALLTYFGLFYASLLCFLNKIFIQKKIKKKEIIVFVLFYLPAVIYEFVNPKFQHYWYSFLFIFPIFILVAITSTQFFFILNQTKKKLAALILGGIVLFLINDAFETLKQYKLIIWPNTYKTTQKVYRSLMEQLQLSPEETFQKVYLEFQIKPDSYRRIKAAGKNLNIPFDRDNSKEDFCYFIFDPSYIYGNNKNLWGNKSQKIDKFIQDKNIKITNYSQHKLSFLNIGFISQLDVYEYIPIKNQSCFNNLYNPFIIDTQMRETLINGKDINRIGGVPVKAILKTENYNKESILEYLEIESVVLNRKYKLPIHINLKIHK